MSRFWNGPRSRPTEDDYGTIYPYALSVAETVSCGTIGFPKITADSNLRARFKYYPKRTVMVRLPTSQDQEAPLEEKDSFIDDVLLGKATIDFIRHENGFAENNIDAWCNCLSVIKENNDGAYYVKLEDSSCEMGVIATEGTVDICTLLPLAGFKSSHPIRCLVDENSCSLEGSTVVIQRAVVAMEDYKFWWLYEDFEKNTSIEMGQRILDVCISTCHLETFVLLENGCLVRFNAQNERLECTIPHLRLIADCGREHFLVGVVGMFEVVLIDFEQKRIRCRHELVCKMAHRITSVLDSRFVVVTDADLAIFDLGIGFVPVLRLDLTLFGIDCTIDHIRWLLPNLLLVLHNNAHILCFIGDLNGADPVIHSLTAEDRIVGLSFDTKTETIYLLFENGILRQMTIDTLLSMDTIATCLSQIVTPPTTRSLGNLDSIIENIFASDPDVPSMDRTRSSMPPMSKAALSMEKYW